jgi:hypothetical protein
MTEVPARRLSLEMLPGTFAICRLTADEPIPAWATARPFFAVVRTSAELSVMCAAELVPADIRASRVWRALRVLGPFDFDLVGIMLAVAAPLAKAGVSIMPVATYDTDYVLVRTAQLEAAVFALRAAGHTVLEAGA